MPKRCFFIKFWKQFGVGIDFDALMAYTNIFFKILTVRTKYGQVKTLRMNENQRVTVNLPLASANCSSADADAPSYSSTPRIGFENVAYKVIKQ
jgi:hypothetical protein